MIHVVVKKMHKDKKYLIVASAVLLVTVAVFICILALSPDKPAGGDCGDLAGRDNQQGYEIGSDACVEEKIHQYSGKEYHSRNQVDRLHARNQRSGILMQNSHISYIRAVSFHVSADSGKTLSAYRIID